MQREAVELHEGLLVIAGTGGQRVGRSPRPRGRYAAAGTAI